MLLKHAAHINNDKSLALQLQKNEVEAFDKLFPDYSEK